MKTYVRPSAFVSAKCAFAIILLSLAAGIASAQTNTFPSTGNVGIGTLSPAAALDVQQDSATANKLLGRFGNNNTSGGGAVRVYANTTSNGTLYPAYELTDSSFWIASLAADRTTGLRFRTGININTGEANLTDRMVVSPGGNVGIGTSNPSAKLHVQRDVNGDNSIYVLNNGGGTSSRTLILFGEANSDAKYAYFGHMGANYAGFGPAQPRSTLFVGADAGGFNLVSYGGASQTGGKISFWTSPDVAGGGNEAAAERMRITSNGHVGIGTTAPTEKLHVAGNGKFTGNLTVDGNIAAKYQDVAEWVESSQELPTGTLVVLDHTRSNQVIASSQAYDTRVAGVLSAQPGITLGERGDNKVLVATTGRVKVKVDATYAPINIGDLLVTSDTPGMAMKSEPIAIGRRQIHSPGTLIGKALEPLEKGCGEILVLLSLQ